ncbi:MAG: TonB-dependent receptor [Steroidobacteraceae bacterium]
MITFSNRHRPRKIVIALIGIALVAFATVTPAQEPTESEKVLQGLEEITVTAQRHEETEQSVPVAITALSADMLERQQIRSIGQLNQVVPNFQIGPNTGTSSSAKIFMRGVGEAESFFTADTPVGIYIDDVYIARQNGATFDLFDIERLEVLRGPQGTLYGRNTTAGAVKLISRRPTLGQFRGQAEATIGSYDRFDVRATGNMPIGDKVALQGAVLMRKRDGYTYNAFDGQDVNDQDVKGARLSLLAELNDRFHLVLSADYISENSTPGYAIPLVLDAARQPPLNPAPKTGSFWVTDSDIGSDAPNDLDMWGVSATLEFEATDNMTITSISAYRAMSNLLYLDADGDVYGPPPSINARYHVRQDQEQYELSQELHAVGKLMDGRLNYITGLFYFREQNDQDTVSVLGLPQLFGRPVASAGRIDLTNIAREAMTTDSYALFGSGTFDVTDQVAVTVGLRYTEESKDFSNNVLLPDGTQNVVCLNTTGAAPVQAAATPCTPAQIGLGYFNFTNQSAFDKTWQEWTPRLVVDYKFTDSALIYASATKGFKGGTTSGRDVAALRNYGRIIGDPETNWSYEAGLKADWLDNRLRTNVAVFRNKYEGLQASLATSDGGFGRINSGNATFDGAELEVVAVPVPGLELNAALGLLDTEYTKWTAALSTCANQGYTTQEQYLNLPLKQAPKWGYRVGANYSYDMGQRGVLSVGGDYTAKDDYTNNVCGTKGISVLDFELLNAQLRWENSTGNALVTLGGTNLTDSKVFNGSFDFGASLGFASGYMYPPRMWFLSVRYKL